MNEHIMMWLLTAKILNFNQYHKKKEIKFHKFSNIT